MRNTYSPEYKAKVLREDLTLSQVATAHGLHPNLISQWRDQARTAIFEYLEVFYRRQRLHSALNYLGPEQFEQQFFTTG
jgi:hypothetical protein